MAAALLWWFVTVWHSPPASLGEAAFREAVRRHHQPSSTRVLDDESLGPAPQRSMPPPALPTQAGSTAEGTVPARDAAWWGARMTAARATLARDRVLVAALESRVAALANDIAARDDPQQRAQVIAARQQALAELERMTQQVIEDERAISAIEDEARKAGVPPGWLRDGEMRRWSLSGGRCV